MGFQTAHLTHPPPTNMATEQTYIMIKPDGVQRGLVGQIIQRFEQKGFFLRGMKMMQVEKSHAEKHYADLSSKPFFGDLVEYAQHEIALWFPEGVTNYEHTAKAWIYE